MTNDIDTLATALYVKTDDLLKDASDLAPWRPAVGFAPRLSDAELVTLAVMQALLLTGTQDEHDGGIDGEDVRL